MPNILYLAKLPTDYPHTKTNSHKEYDIPA